MKIQCVIATHLMRRPTIFYDFTFKWTATAGIGIHPTKAWLSQLVNFKNAIWTLEERYAIKFCLKLGKNAMQWKLDLLLWPRDQEKHAGSSRPKKARQSKSTTNFWWSLFWQHWHDQHALGSHWTDSQQGILCWGFKGVQEEIPSEEASTLQIRLVAFPPGQFLTVPIVQTLLPVTFGYSLSPEAVVIRHLRRWKRLWRRSLTRSHKRTSMGPFRNYWNSTTSASLPEEITSKGLEFHVCTINKSAHTKKSLETYLMILVYI